VQDPGAFAFQGLAMRLRRLTSPSGRIRANPAIHWRLARASITSTADGPFNGLEYHFQSVRWILSGRIPKGIGCVFKMAVC
jgi:hypothetical protein